MIPLLIALTAAFIIGLVDHLASESMTAHLNRASTGEPPISQWLTWQEVDR